MICLSTTFCLCCPRFDLSRSPELYWFCVPVQWWCCTRHRVPVPSLARWLLRLGIAVTLTANMAQGWSHGPVGAVVAAWPAVSLVGSYELLVWLIRTSGTAEHSPPSGHLGDVAACRAAAPSASTAATAIEFPACIIRFCAKVTP